MYGHTIDFKGNAMKTLLYVNKVTHNAIKEQAEALGLTMSNLVARWAGVEDDIPTVDLNVAWQEAKAAGLDKYHDKPCGYGHGTLRYTSNRSCVTCAKIRAKIPAVMDEDFRARVVRYELLKEGVTTYTSNVACSCGSTARWCRSGQCASCWTRSGRRV